MRGLMGCTGCSIGTKTNPGGNFVGVRLADAEDGKTTLLLMGEIPVKKGEKVIVETDTGPEFAEVTTLTPAAGKACSTKKAKRFLRLASDSDHADYIDRIELQDRAYRFASEYAERKKIDVRIVKCAVGFDRRKITILYTSDARADVRDLTRDLANEFKLRADARLIGARDETKLIGGIGSCGLSLCCSTWLKTFHPVTIRMVKLQGVVPNPSRFTGVCGRLKCCIAYELDGGIEAARHMGQERREAKEGKESKERAA